MADSSIGDGLKTLGAHRFEQIFDYLPVPCLTFGLDGRVVECNRAGVQLFWSAGARPIGSTVAELFCTNEAQISFFQDMLHDVLAGLPYDRLDWHLLPVGKHLVCSLIPIQNGETVVGGMITGVDVTPLRSYEDQIAEQLTRLGDYSIEMEQHRADLTALNRQLQELATTDSLTGLLNRRALSETLTREIKRVKREGTALSLAILDVDRFKDYNDSFGHPAGDEALAKIGHILVGQARETDSVARYGGEEFVLIMPGAPVTGSLTAAERFRRAVECASWTHRKITASFGIATYTSNMTAEDLLATADAALYESKANGRNRVTHGNPDSEPDQLAA